MLTWSNIFCSIVRFQFRTNRIGETEGDIQSEAEEGVWTGVGRRGPKTRYVNQSVKGIT